MLEAQACRTVSIAAAPSHFETESPTQGALLCLEGKQVGGCWGLGESLLQ